MSIINKFPIGQYVDGNNSWLRIIDGRLKLIILSIFLLSPIWAGSIWRISLVLFLIFITFVSGLPSRVWWRALLFLIILSLFIGSLSILATSNISNLETTFRDTSELKITLGEEMSWNVFQLPLIKIGFFEIGPYNLSKRALELAIKTSTLIFTVVHSVNLFLLTTLKEDIVWSLSWFLNPLRSFGIPIDKWLFQLLLALRFIPLVQEELQNVLKSLSVRSINLKKLGLKNTFKIFINLIERIFLNIFLRIEQGSESLLSKGFFEIKTKRFKLFDKQNYFSFVMNSLSIVFIIIAILLRKQYGSI